MPARCGWWTRRRWSSSCSGSSGAATRLTTRAGNMTIGRPWAPARWPGRRDPTLRPGSGRRGMVSILDRIWRWRNAFAEERRRQPSREDRERAEAERERQQRERFEDEVAQLIVWNGGSYFPNDALGQPRDSR